MRNFPEGSACGTVYGSGHGYGHGSGSGTSIGGFGYGYGCPFGYGYANGFGYDYGNGIGRGSNKLDCYINGNGYGKYPEHLIQYWK